MRERLDVSVRWMIRRDMPEVLEIEDDSESPWCEEVFVRYLKQRNCVGMVAEHDRQLDEIDEEGNPQVECVVVGFMVYELHKNRIDVMNFAVHPSSRRRGVGMQMVKKLFSKLTADRRTRLRYDVREANLSGQQFLRRLGWCAVSVSRSGHVRADGTMEDSYRMEYEYLAGLRVLKNRMTERMAG